MMSFSDFYDTEYDRVIKKTQSKLLKIHPNSTSLMLLLDNSEFIDDMMSKAYQDYINSTPKSSPLDDWM